MLAGALHTPFIDTPLIQNRPIGGGREALSGHDEMLDNGQGGESAGCQIDTVRDVLSALESRALSPQCPNATYACKAVASIRKNCGNPDVPFDDRFVAAWISRMQAAGMAASSVRRYVEAARALYRRDYPSGRAFDGLDNALAAPRAMVDFSALRRAAARNGEMRARLRVALDAFLVDVYSGARLGTSGLVTLLKDDCAALPVQAQAIVETYASPRRRYAFPLAQGRRTDASIARTLAVATSAALRLAGIVASDTAATPSEIAAECSRIACAGAASLQEAADAILDIHPRWYAMHMRRGMAVETAEERLRDAFGASAATYYPCREVVCRTAEGRLATTLQPFIPGVLFFRVSPQLIPEVFRHVGDIAWGYRSAPATDAPYAAIPEASMLVFQRMVCIFTPDMTLRPLDPATRLIPGRRVRITGGVMAGYEGIVRDIPASGDSPLTRLFRLEFGHDFGFEWTADIPEALIQPLN